MTHPNIPKQNVGSHQDIVSMHCCEDFNLAREKFDILKLRLKSVNTWHTLSDDIKSTFKLIDEITANETVVLKVGNKIRIDVPGPGNPSGKGYDWTEIIDIQSGGDGESYEFFGFTIRPCPKPKSFKETVAHFYKDQATNTFIIRMVGTSLYAEVHGRNQVNNTENVPVLDLVRNTAVAVGSVIGLSNLNWVQIMNAMVSHLE